MLWSNRYDCCFLVHIFNTVSQWLIVLQVKETLTVQTEDSSCQDDSAAVWPTSFKNDIGRTSFAGLEFPKVTVGTALSLSSTILSGNTVESAEEGDISAQHFDIAPATCPPAAPSSSSRLFAYIDLHGHASKRGLSTF